MSPPQPAQHIHSSNQANQDKQWSFDLCFPAGQSMCSDNTGSRMEEQNPSPAHDPDTCPQAVPEPGLSPRSCRGHWGSATSLPRLCSIQNAPAKSIPTPDKLFSNPHQHFPPIWAEETQPIVPKISCRATRTGRRRQQRFLTICRAQHTLFLSTALTKIPGAGKLGSGEAEGTAELCRAGTACTQHSKALAWQHWESRSIPPTMGEQIQTASS